MSKTQDSLNGQVNRPDRKNAPEDDDTIDLFALIQTIWVGKWFIAFCVIVALCIGSYRAYVVAVPLYSASAVVILETGQASPIDLQSVIAGPTGSSTEVKSEVEILRARTLMGRVVDRLDLTADPEFNPKLRVPSQYDVYREQVISQIKQTVKGFLGLPVSTGTGPSIPEDEVILKEQETAVSILLSKMSVQNVTGSLVFRISIEAQNARKAALIADTVVQLYIINQIDVKFDAMEQATKFLSERVAELQIELETSEAAISDFSAETDLVSLEIIREAELELSELRSRSDSAFEILNAFETELAAYQAAESVVEKVAVAEDLQLERLAAQIDNDPSFVGAFDARYQTLTSRVVQNLESGRAQLQAIQQGELLLEIRIAKQSNDLIALQQLTREAEATRLLYEYFLTRLKEVSAQQGIQQADSRVLSHAVVPTAPVSPRKSRILALSLMLGAMIGVGIVLLRDVRKRGFKTATELEQHTGISVYGQIPLMKLSKRNSILAYLKDKPASSAAEAVRDLRTSLMLSNIDNPPKVIISTSAMSGEGKTTTSLALSQNFAAMGQKVLLIEGDIRRRTLSSYFDTVPSKGIVSALAGEGDLGDLKVTSSDYGFDIIFGEKTTANAADVFSSRRFKDFIEEQRAFYDIVIIDTPPVLIVPDSRIIAQVADALLFSVRWDHTTQKQVDESLRLMRNANLNVTGLVLGQVNVKGAMRYGYGVYGSYGSEYYAN